MSVFLCNPCPWVRPRTIWLYGNRVMLVGGFCVVFVWVFWMEQCAIWLYDNRVMPVGGPSHFGSPPTQPSHPLDRLEASLDHPDGEEGEEEEEEDDEEEEKEDNDIHWWYK